MAKSDMKVHQYRMDGMAYALKIVKEQGIEALEKEIRMRNGRFIPLELTREKQMEVSMTLASRIVNTYSTMTMAALHDGFGFGKKRLQEFIKVFNEKCEVVDVLDPYGEHYATISDYAKMMEEEYDIHVDLDAIYRAEADHEKNRRKSG